MPITTADVQAHAADPALAAALTAGDDVAAAARLSQLLTEPCPIPIGRVAAWGASVGLRAKIEDYANDPDSPMRGLSLTALDMLVRGSDFDMAEDGALLDAFVDSGDISQAQRDYLASLAVRPRSVSVNDVARAVRNEDGSSKL